MKKKIFAVALAATMALSSVMTAFGATVYTNEWTNTANDTITKVANPLLGSTSEKIVISYDITCDAAAAANGWDGIFAFFDQATKGRVSFQTRPYVCYNSEQGEKGYLDINHADNGGDFALNKEAKQTVEWTFTKTSVTCTVDGTAINLGTDGGAATYADVFDAITTYPELTLGVGLAESSYWNTELATIALTIEDDAPAATKAPAGDTDTTATTAAGTTATTAGTGTPETSDVATTSIIILAAVAAIAVVVLKKKEVTE